MVFQILYWLGFDFPDQTLNVSRTALSGEVSTASTPSACITCLSPRKMTIDREKRGSDPSLATAFSRVADGDKEQMPVLG